MLTYPDIDPVAFEIGSLQIYWYGISYLLGFFVAYWVLLYRKNTMPAWNKSQILDLFFYIALGIIFGGRLGYILIYEFSHFLEEPLTVFAFWARGRSFHGGLLGVLIAVFIFAVIHKRKFLDITDFIAPAIPIGLGFGRLGNFINGELWGRVTDVPWGMVFPYVGPLPRHPSQLYEFLLEGVFLFLILFIYSSKPRLRGKISGLFLLWYGIFRFLVEFLREPDIEQGFILFDGITMGQWLSFPMVIFGLFFLFRRVKIDKEKN